MLLSGVASMALSAGMNLKWLLKVVREESHLVVSYTSETCHENSKSKWWDNLSKRLGYLASQLRQPAAHCGSPRQHTMPSPSCSRALQSNLCDFLSSSSHK